SAIAALQVEAYLLTFMQIADPRALDRRDVNKDVLRAVLGLDKAVTLCSVEPFNGSSGHQVSFKIKCRRSEASGGSNCGTVRRAGPALNQELGRASRTTGSRHS